MLITDRFVFAHMPKTGGLFVDRVLKDMLCPSRVMQGVDALRHRYKIRIPGFPYRYVFVSRRASCTAIPEKYRHLPILACRRNPFDWYVSDYCYGAWRKPTSIATFWSHEDNPKQRYPNWPELSFSEYVDATTHCSMRVVQARRRSEIAGTLGVATLEFLRMFCEDREYVFAAECDEQLHERMKTTLYPVHFLEMTNLNHELYEYLLERAYPEQMVAQVLDRQRINASARGQKNTHDWRDYYTAEAWDQVRCRERMLLKLFPQYEKPLTANDVACPAESAGTAG